jgi:hypothetical protein
MKIGILTLWWSEDNYGQQLQCYALQKYLCNMGHDAYLIRYDPRGDLEKTPIYKKILKIFNPREIEIYINYKRKELSSHKDNNKHPRFFSDFREKYIKQTEKIYTSWNELKTMPPDADIYVVGSDQVWNFYNYNVKKCHNLIHAFFLDFGTAKIKRISYAASWGGKHISSDLIREITPLLKRFNLVTVREKSGIEICHSCGFEDAKWVIDPTMLLKPDNYRELYVKPKKKLLAPYIFFYYLNNGGSFIIRDVYNWAEKKKMNVEYVGGNSNTDSFAKDYVTIPEWLYLIDHAEFVITNSFHCCIFSILFHKKFGAIRLTGSNCDMNERLDSLFQLFNIQPRYIDGFDFSCMMNGYHCDMPEYQEIFNDIKNE